MATADELSAYNGKAWSTSSANGTVDGTAGFKEYAQSAANQIYVKVENATIYSTITGSDANTGNYIGCQLYKDGSDYAASYPNQGYIKVTFNSDGTLTVVSGWQGTSGEEGSWALVKYTSEILQPYTGS